MTIARKLPSGSVPVPSRYLTVQASDVAIGVAAFERASLEAHRAFLETGRRLVDARGECRHGAPWGRFLEAAGVEPRAAADMMMLSKAGLSSERVTELGGVRAALESLREAAADAVEVAGQAETRSR